MRFLFFVVLMLCVIYSVSSSTSGVVNSWEPYTMYIIDSEIQNLIVHVHSKDNDLGNHTMTIRDTFHWEFRMNFGETTEFSGKFYWMMTDNQVYREVAFPVFNNQIAAECGNKLVKTNKCFWLVKYDGFYLSKGSPSDGRLKYSWGLGNI